MGAALSLVSQSLPPKSKFSVEDIPDLTGKVVIVTGANSGVGKETAKALLSRNAKVYLAGRSQEKVERAIQELKQETGKEGIFLHLDLGDLKSVKKAAEEFISKEKKLHILFNNAGVMTPPIDMVTTQGYDLQFGTNVLGHFYLTKLLYPTLLSTVKSSPDWKPRVVHTASVASLFGELNFNTFKDGPARRKSFSVILYAQSKLGNVIVANEFAKRYGDQGVISCSCNPGNLKTELTRYTPSIATALMNAFVLYPAPYGALTQLWAGTSEEGLKMNGKYLVPWARYGTPNPLALDEKLGEDLWNWLEEQVQDV
ncbi:short-chain dehydrogenase [Coprinopsis cinerea AmutBmut pab1-1]|nr:short-chain dehydrogenase [Coprinopsis cinerea AmutBmut pab1-1]